MERRVAALRADAPEESPVEGRGRPGEAHGVVVRRMLVAADVLAVAVALVIGLLLGDADGRGGRQLAYGWPAVAVMVMLFKVYGLYDRDAKRISHTTVDDMPAVLHALLVGTLLLWAYLKVVAGARMTLVQSLLVLGVGFVAVLLARALARWVALRAGRHQRVLLVGQDEAAALLVRKIRAHPEYALDLVGFASVRAGGGLLDGSLQRLGAPAELAELCERHAIERVILASPTLSDDELTEMVRQANQAQVSVSVLPAIVDVLGSATELDDLEGVTVLGISPARLTPSSRALKRTLDLVVAGAALLVLFPLLPLVALAIKLDSRGPVFFVHRRLGRAGREFRLYKLRTMSADAEERLDELRKRSRHPAWLLLDSDPRITRVGRLLRNASIDELPQLWNVIRGDMSLVGPRPMPPNVDQHITGWGRRRLELTPGLTGLWQVLGRTAIPFEEMIKLDYLYLTSWSLWGDVRLLLRTVSVVLSRRGVN